MTKTRDTDVILSPSFPQRPFQLRKDESIFNAIMYLTKCHFCNLQGLVNVGDSVSVTLKKVLDKKILPALKPTFSDGKENLDESLDFMIQNAVEVCSSFSHFFTKVKKVYVSKRQVQSVESEDSLYREGYHIVTGHLTTKSSRHQQSRHQEVD